MPIYIAAIGPKNTQLTGEIADGWLPTFFSPEHVGESKELLEEGARRGGKDGWPTTSTSPRTCNVCDRRRRGQGARHDAPDPRAVRRRHGVAREELLQPARAALRVRGGREEGAGPVPRRQEGRGRRGAARRADRHGRAGRAEGSRARTGSAPTATPASARSSRPRWRATSRRARGCCASSRSCSEPGPRRRILLAAFGDPGHAFPAIALGRELVRARPRASASRRGTSGRRTASARGCGSPPRRSTRCSRLGGTPLKPYQAAVRASRTASR